MLDVNVTYPDNAYRYSLNPNDKSIVFYDRQNRQPFDRVGS
jgi:hypothetical protein